MTRAASLLCLVALACDRRTAAPPSPTPAPRAAAAAPAHAVLGPGDTVPGTSIYALDVALRDQDGRAIKLDVFRGHPVIISMFYASCPHACPLLVSNVLEVEAALPPEVRDKTRVLLVSFDPARDTAEVLREVIGSRKLDRSRWTLATAPDDQVREIAAVLGIKYREAVLEGDGGVRREYNHSSVITLLDAEGRIDLRADGLVRGAAPVASRLSELARR